MLTTRLYVECPNCRLQYLVKKGALYYSNGAYIEKVAGSSEWQRLLCPCRPENPYKFKLSCFSHPIYENGSNVPRWLEFGLLKDDETLWVEVFEN
jgi:hypothetical protein